MQEFIAGFVVALLLAAGVAFVLFLRSKSSGRKVSVPGNNSVSHRQLEELGKLTGGLAHEIKNPLSTVKINLKLAGEDLAESGDSSTIRRASKKISVIQKETDRLEQILDGFLRYVGKTELQLAEVDVNELLSDMADFYSPQAQSHSVIIRLGLCDERLICRADSDMLKQVLLNLFINAQQAMPQGGELMIRTTKQDGFSKIEISDTGIGIEPDKILRIFDAYYSSQLRGSGLGLPIAKKIIEAHNGEISATSESGKGTSFMIKLPLNTD
ncbi:MAG: sensor histidine kinase [Planctomycetota bacterium]